MNEPLNINGLKITPEMHAVFARWFNSSTQAIDSEPLRFVNTLMDVQDVISEIVYENRGDVNGKNQKYHDIINTLITIRQDFKAITPNSDYYE